MEKEKTRTENSVRNTTVSMVSRIIAIFMGFFTRIVFTHTLNEAYVGVNGLFSDIIAVLALSELGFGTAITYALYQPIAQKDVEKQKSLMQLYRRFYQIVAGIVLVAGLLVIPFMDVLIKNQPDVDHLTLIYLMYLANSVLSYLWIYKRTLIDAHQLLSIGVIYQTASFVIQDVVQMIVLLTTKNFILYLSINLVCTLVGNVAISKKADKLYPFLKDKDVKPLEKTERLKIFRDIKAMLMHKIGNVVVNNTDNLVLSSMVGIVSVGKYSNYYLVIGSVRQVLNQAFAGITASVGNLGASGEKRWLREVFEIAFFAGQWVFGFSAICLFELINPFVSSFFGSQYVFETSVVFILCLNFYITGMRQATLVFRDSLGLFWYDRYKAIIEAVLNLGISIALALSLKTAGVFWGTFISSMLTSVWIEPFVLYRYLAVPLRNYFIRYGIYGTVTAVTAVFVHWLCLERGFIGRIFICGMIPNLIWLLCYGKTREFRSICRRLNSMFRNRRNE